MTAGQFGPGGVLDLSSLQQGASAPAPAPASGGGAAAEHLFKVQLTEQNFGDIIQGTAEVPLLVEVTSGEVPKGAQLTTLLASLVDALGGRMQFASVDMQKDPQIAGAFGQLQQLPTVLVVVAARPMPLFEGPQDPQQVAALLQEILAAAEQQGLRGVAQPSVPVDGVADAAPALPPLHQQALDALGRNDLVLARASYEQALKDDPSDADAEAGLARVGLLERTSGASLTEAREAAAAAPADLQAQFLVADLDIAGGHIEDGFLRLIDLLRTLDAEGKDAVRAHLLSLFACVGKADPRVAKARRSMAAALY